MGPKLPVIAIYSSKQLKVLALLVAIDSDNKIMSLHETEKGFGFYLYFPGTIILSAPSVKTFSSQKRILFSDLHQVSSRMITSQDLFVWD